MLCQTLTRLLVYATDLQACRSTTVDVDVDVDGAARGRLGDGMIYVHVVSTMDLSSKQRVHAALYSEHCNAHNLLTLSFCCWCATTNISISSAYLCHCATDTSTALLLALHNTLRTQGMTECESWSRVLSGHDCGVW